MNKNLPAAKSKRHKKLSILELFYLNLLTIQLLREKNNLQN